MASFAGHFVPVSQIVNAKDAFLKEIKYAAGEGNGNPLQCSCLENLRYGGACGAAVYGVAQSWTQLK